MALNKKIVQPDGVECSYFRVSSVSITTNESNSVEVVGYLTADARESEKSEEGWAGYTAPVPYSAPYDQTMTVDSAYGYLKALPEFAGAVDC